MSRTQVGTRLLGVGAVLQVVKGGDLGASFSTSSTTFVDTAVSVTITPKSTTSRIIIMPSVHILDVTSGQNGGQAIQVRRSTTTPIGESAFVAIPGVGAAGIAAMNGVIMYSDFPGVVTATQYKLYIRTNNASDNATLGYTTTIAAGLDAVSVNYANFLTAWEIAA